MDDGDLDDRNPQTKPSPATVAEKGTLDGVSKMRDPSGKLMQLSEEEFRLGRPSKAQIITEPSVSEIETVERA